MKPGMYINLYTNNSKFVNLYKDNLGWCWTVFNSGEDKDIQMDEDGNWLYKTTGQWSFNESRHKKLFGEKFAPIELARW